MIDVIRALRFNPAPLPTFAALLAVALTGYLGYWQQTRAVEKRATQVEFESRARQSAVELDARTRDPALRHRIAKAAGEWHPAGQIYVDNQVTRRMAGFHVITPLRLRGTNTYILVNRGWIARGASYPIPPPAESESGNVTVAGQLSIPSARFLELTHQSVQGSVWQNLTIERYRTATQLDVLPFVLLARYSPPPLESVGDRPDAGADKHIEYMLTWYSLAATVFILWVVLNTRHVRAIPRTPESSAVHPAVAQNPQEHRS